MKYHGRVFSWIEAQLETSKGRPFFVGVSGSQGAGKTTLTRNLCQLARARGLAAAALSIDDFYLTRTQQVDLAARNPANPYLQQRGYPGTHDVAQGVHVLNQLKAGAKCKIPRYDKSAAAGQGDRSPESEWTEINQRLDLVFLEGWMLGFSPVETCPNTNFRMINELLPPYESWMARMNAFVWLEPREIQYVVDWRIEAEERMKAEGKPGMSAAEIRAYVEKFLIAYETYLPGMKNRLRGSIPALHFVLGADREPID